MTPILAGVALVLCCLCDWVEYHGRFYAITQVPEGYTVEATSRKWSPLQLRSEGSNVVLAWGSGAVAFRYSGSLEYPLGVTHRWDDHWFITPRDGYVSIDHSERTVRVNRRVVLPAQERGLSYDAVCERERIDLSRGWEQVRVTEHRDVAGYRVVAYSVSSQCGGATFAFAPELGCMTMSIREVTKNGWRIPVSFSYWEVTAVRRGELNPVLLQKPVGYRVVEE